MDRRNNGGGGDYGSGDGGGGRAGGSRYDRQHDQLNDAGGGGGRWQNDMYDSSAQQPRRGSHGGGGGGYRERGGYQHDQRDHRGDGGGRGRSYGGGGGGDRYGGGGGGRRDNARGGGGGYRDYQSDNNFAGQSGQQQNWPTPAGAAGDAREGGEGGGGVGGGGERWQKHAQALSGRSGGGGYNSQQRHGQQNQRPEVSGEREQGRVCSMKESFGFVRCMDRPGDLFFHLTEAPPNINVGDEVDFFVGMGNRSGKDCALKLNLLPPGTVSSETILDASFLGVIERDIRSYPSSMPSTHRANMMGRSRPQEYQQSEGLIKITGAAPPVEPPAADDTTAPPEGEVQPTDATEGGDGTDASPETENAVAGVDDAAGAASPTATTEIEEAVAVRSTQPAPASDGKDNGDRAAPLGLQGVMVSYLVTDGLEEDAGSRFRRGDEVRFKVSQEKITGRKRAVEVVLVRTNREKREGEQLQKLIDSGATKQQGVVKKLTHDYGFLRSLSCPETVYFNTAHVVQSREGDRLRVGSQAEFWVVPDRTKDRRESFRALEIKILPPGSLTLEEETHKSLRGTVERAPTFPHRQSFGGGREGGGGGGGMQPGSARFVIPAPDTAEEGEEASPEGGEGPGAAAAKATSVVASLNHKELGKSQVPTLEVGDIIEADLWKSKLGGGTTQVKNVKLVSFGGERVEGVVKNLRDGGFGFIRPLGGTEDVYFRISDTCKNLPDLREGSEVVFTQHESERGGDKKRATRVEVCPKGTLKVEVPLATCVSGVVTRDAKGGGQGMLTITDGNNLEMPAEVKFPKIAAQVREFAQSEEKALVFPSGLSAGERNAAHSLAAGEGLGHESREDEGKRALHLWKPESEEEAVSIKEAESKRAEERSNAIKERSKNGERSQSVPFTREDTASAKPDDKSQDPEKAANTQQQAGGEGAPGNGNAPPQKPSKSKLTQDFRTEKGFAGFAAAAQRGDLVTFDVMLDRGSMKRRATNVKVTKRASPQGSSANANSAANSASGGAGSGQEHGSGQEQEYMGVVSLVQLERHYGFIEVLDMDERVFFHLSEVLPDDNDTTTNNNNNIATPGGGGSAPNDKDSSGDGNAESATEVEGTPSTAAGNGNAKPAPIIKRGQEVAFRIGQRQGKPLGLRVRKLRQGTLPTEESLPCRFVGVVVVPPRNVGTVDKEKDAMASAAGMEGMLVMLQEKSTAQASGNAATAELPPAPPADGAAQGEDGAGIATEESSVREAEKEASKAQRMLSLAGIRVASLPQDAAASATAPSSLSSSIAEQAPSSSLLLNPNGISSGKRRASRGGGGAAPKPPPRFSILCFLAETGGKGMTAAAAAAAAAGGGGEHREDVPTTEVAAAGAVGGVVSYGRGDLVEFTVAARRGQRQQSHRVGDVSLVTKEAYPCRRGKVLQVDAKAGVAHVELLQAQGQGADQPCTEEPKPKEEKEVDATAEAVTTADAAATAPPASSPADSSTAEGAACRVFFLLKEMVGAAGPLRNGDEVDLMLPTSLPRVASQTPKGGKSPGGVHAVGAVRVQDLKSLSGARQRLNINLRDSQKGPQVRMALGPDGNGFKQGHRASQSLYEKAATAPSSTDTTKVSEGKEEKAKVIATEVAVDAAETVDQEEQHPGES